MDNKTWLWKKRSSEKTIVAATKSDLSSKGNEEEIVPTEKEISLERSLGNVNEKLASALCEIYAKDELLAKHAKMAEDAIKDREKAEEAALSLTQELEKASQDKVALNERLTQLNAALKESMQQLTSIREDQEQSMRDAVMKTSTEFEKAQRKLEEKLTEKSKRLSNLTVENARLSKTLIVKEKLIEELKSQAEAEFNALMGRLDTVEKENTFLKYEFRMLEKELQIRNEEIEFNRQSVDVAHKQYMESVKKISKLETECQRLRVLVRKRLPGPASLAKMKGEVEVLGSNQSEMRRRKPTGSLLVRDSTLQNPPDIPNKISFLIERLCELEEENNNLKQILAKKDDELHCTQIVCSQTASQLCKVEAQLGDQSKGQESIELSDMRLMDDFVEMEKLAIVTVGTPLGSSCASSDANNADARGKELVPVDQGQSNYNQGDNQAKDKSNQEAGYDWLQDVLKLILDQTHISKRSFDDLLEDIRISLTYMKSSCATEANKEESFPISGYITWKSPNTSPGVSSLDGVPQDISSVREKTNNNLGSDKSPRASELENEVDGEFSESNGQTVKFETEKTKSDSREENRGLKDELKNVESQLRLANDKSEGLMNQLRESKKSIGDLQTELKSLKESKGMIEDQIENQKLINEDLDTQLNITRVQLNEVLQKLSSLEVEMEDKSHCCEELETTCLELQLQLESATNKEAPKDINMDQEERLLQTGWEITAASAKLAECQETILTLGKQLKALASRKETSVLDKVSSTNTTSTTTTTTITNKKLSQRSSLLDQMLAEDGGETEDPDSPKTKEIISTVDANKPISFLNFSNGSTTAAVGSLAIVPSKKRGGGVGFLRKLLLRRKRGSSKKGCRSFAT